MSSSGSERPHASFAKFLHRGATYHRPKIIRSTVRHVSFDGPLHRKGHYEAIVDRMGAMADRHDRKSGARRKVVQFTVFAFRGFGIHHTSLASGAYGDEMERLPMRQARPERYLIWREKLRIPITNQIAKAASSGLFGNVASEGTDRISVTLGDCIALGSSSCRSNHWGGGKIEPPSKGPQTMTRFINAAKQHIRLFCFL